MDAETLKKNLSAVRDGIRPEVKILIATKYAGAEDIAMLALTQDMLLVGENRVREAEEKMEWIMKNHAPAMEKIEWHMIGHLQSNKAKRAVKTFSCIQSVDTVKIADRIDSAAGMQDKEMPVYLEVNVSGEDSKFGFEPGVVREASEVISMMENLKVQGLMAMAPHVEPERTRKYFRQIKELADFLKLKTSMGMSNDYKIAVEEGSDMVRIGRAVFSPRKPS